MLNNPKISVCIPVYNREKYIAQCIESVISQDYRNIEIIISDNCSTDGTVDIIKRYLYDKRIRFYQNKTNLGMFGNVTKMMNYIKGDRLIFLSSDDYWTNATFLSLAVNMADKYSDLAVFCGGKMVLNESSNTVHDLSDNTDAVFDGESLFLRGLDTWPTFEAGAMVINTAIFKNAFSNCINVPGDDVLFFWQLCLQGKIYILRKPFLMFRNHDNNTCRWKSVEDFVQRIIVNAIVPVKTYSITVKKNLFLKKVLYKWLIKNILLFMTGSGSLSWTNFDRLKDGYENILVERGFSVDEFGMEPLFGILKEINAFENKLYYYTEDLTADDLGILDEGTSLLIKNYIDRNYESGKSDYGYIFNNDLKLKTIIADSIKIRLELIGGFNYDYSIKSNLAKSGINKKNIRDFFDVFIYSKIYAYRPEKLQSVSFINAPTIGALEYIERHDAQEFTADNADIFCSGWILNALDKTPPEKVYILLTQNNLPKYFIEAKIKERLDVAKELGSILSKDCGYYFVVPSDAILIGQYDVITLYIKGNNALVFDNNKKIIL